MSPRTLRAAGAVALVVALAGCTESSSASGGTRLDVTSTDDACTVSAAQAPAGPLTFSVTNEGSEVTEFYLLAEDREKVVAEVEDVGPGVTRDLSLTAEAGSYWTSCKPGMTGDGIQAAFRVTDAVAGSDGY